jgi:hypothetical protein
LRNDINGGVGLDGANNLNLDWNISCHHGADHDGNDSAAVEFLAFTSRARIGGCTLGVAASEGRCEYDD